MDMAELLKVAYSILVGDGHRRDTHLTNLEGVARLLVTSIQMALINKEAKLDLQRLKINGVKTRTLCLVTELSFWKEVVFCMMELHSVCIDLDLIEGLTTTNICNVFTILMMLMIV